MAYIVNIEQDGVKIRPVYGGQKVVVSARVKIEHCSATRTDSQQDSHIEFYEIEFSRDQIKGWVNYIEVSKREETTTTEHTLTCEAVQDLVNEYLIT